MTDGTHVSWGACTDRGLKRAVNEDGYLAETPVFLVADGMGGHEAGSEASRLALDCFAALAGRLGATPEDVEVAFGEAVRAVEAIETTAYAAGTTLSGVVLCERGGVPYWLVLNIGDSRTYRFAGGRLEQISIDHSAVQAMVDRGELTAAEAERHPQRNVVTRAVGAGSSGAPDYWLLPAGEGDRIVICSDGLTKELSADQIRGVLVAEPAAQAAATRLVHEALLAGGRDNTTVVVVDAHRVAGIDDDPTTPVVEIDEDTRPREDPVGEGKSRAQV